VGCSRQTLWAPLRRWSDVEGLRKFQRPIPKRIRTPDIIPAATPFPANPSTPPPPPPLPRRASAPLPLLSANPTAAMVSGHSSHPRPALESTTRTHFAVAELTNPSPRVMVPRRRTSTSRRRSPPRGSPRRGRSASTATAAWTSTRSSTCPPTTSSSSSPPAPAEGRRKLHQKMVLLATGFRAGGYNVSRCFDCVLCFFNFFFGVCVWI
jgi:hypothetical protein